MHTLRICVVGMGRHGRGCFLALQWLSKQNAGVFRNRKIEVSFCSSNPQVRSGNWKGLRPPNLGIALPDQVDMTDVTVFERLEDVQADLVWICAPTSEHRRLAEYFLGKNVHVIVEKPIALNLIDSEAILAAGIKSIAKLMVAHELFYFSDFRLLNQRISIDPSAVDHMRLVRNISTADETVGVQNVAQFGGPGIDLHIHCVHAILTMFGLPCSILSQGFGDKGANYYESGVTYYNYDGGLQVVSTWGAVAESGLVFRHGFEVRFKDGRQMHYRLDVTGKGVYQAPPITLFQADSDGNLTNSTLLATAVTDVPNSLGPLVSELEEALLTIVRDTGRGWVNFGDDHQSNCPLCPLTAHRALEICLLERHSWKVGCAVALSDLPQIRPLL